MVGQDRIVNGKESILAGKTYSKGSKMTLQSWIDGERSSCWVHTCDVLTAVDVFLCQLISVIPV